MVISSSLVNVFLFKPPPYKPYDFPSRVVTLTTNRGQEISATYVRKRGARVTVLFSHGNAEDLNSSYWFMERIAKSCDVNVFAYDYTGYGCNESDPSEEDCYADIEAAYEYLLKEKKLNPEQIVLYGRSLGSGPSTYLADKTSRQGRPVAGLILHSPFTSVYRVVYDFGFTVLGDKFSNIDRVSQLDCKVLIVHGQADDIVPVEHGLALHEAVPEKMKAEPLFLHGMGHNGFSCHEESMLLRRINQFLDYHVLARQLWMKGMTKSKRNHPNDGDGCQTMNEYGNHTRRAYPIRQSMHPSLGNDTTVTGLSPFIYTCIALQLQSYNTTSSTSAVF